MKLLKSLGCGLFGLCKINLALSNLLGSFVHSLFSFQNDVYINLKEDIKFLTSGKLEVTILLGKSEKIKPSVGWPLWGCRSSKLVVASNDKNGLSFFCFTYMNLRLLLSITCNSQVEKNRVDFTVNSLQCKTIAH